MTNLKLLISLVASLSLSLAACGSDDGGGGGNITPEPIDPNGTFTKYVVSDLVLPTSQAEATALGLNIDGDSNGIEDNALGKILATLQASASGELDLGASVSGSIQSGTLILLATLQATDLTNAGGAGLAFLIGSAPSTTPCTDPNDITTCGKHLDGATSFTVDNSADALGGSITSGNYVGGPGEVTIQLALVDDAPPLPLRLVGARAEVSVSATGLLQGRLGGAVTEDDLNNDVIPALAGALAASAEPDCQGSPPDDCCVEGSTGALISGLFNDFDIDDSCTITVEEVSQNALISTLLAPDVDLFDADGNFNPGVDGIADALSLGVGFEAVNAEFTLP